MKYIFLIILLTLPFIYAQDQNLILAKEIYSQKETFQAEIFMEGITPLDISVLNPIGYKSNIGINLVKISRGHYFIFFDIPKLDSGFYTLKVKDEKKQFQIKPKAEKTISISPPVIKFAPEYSFISKITISNHDIKAETVNILSASSDLIPSVNSLIIPGKSSKSFYINLEEPRTTSLSSILIGDYYKIPVWYISEEKLIPFFEKEIREQIPSEEGLNFYTKSNTQINYITKEIQESVPIVDSIFIQNNLDVALTNLKIEVTYDLQEIVKLGFEELETLAPNEKKKLDITVNENRLLSKDSYSGDLLITTDKHTFKLPMNFMAVIIAEEPESLTIEQTTEPVKEVEEKPQIKETKLEGKYLYLTALIIIFIIFAYFFLRKPRKKKQTFKQFIRKIKH